MYIDTIHFWVQYPKEVKAGSQDICTHVHRNIIHSCQKLEIAQITIDG